MKKKMYVLVRKELDATYRAVQGAHALAQYARTHQAQFEEWRNRDLIFLGVRFNSGIDDWRLRLAGKDILYSAFREPDLDQWTALACYCEPKVFEKLSIA